jgi:hypothetical protein
VEQLNREQQGELEAIVDDNGAILPNSSLREGLYRAFVYLKYGNLVKEANRNISSGR